MILSPVNKAKAYMKKNLLILTLYSGLSFGQTINLVPNPSFESNNNCPSNVSQINFANNWFNCGIYTPDYYHSCATSTLCDVPGNWMGNQQPATGQAYAGIYCYSGNDQGLHELIGTPLLSPMIIGQNYYVEFKTCRSDQVYSTHCSSNKLGARFSTTTGPSTTTTFNNFAHVYSNTIITDSVNWITISGNIVADSAYTWLTVGNFFSDDSTSSIPTGIYYSYYYIDDVNVIGPDRPNGIKNNPADENSIVFPNPSNGSFFIGLNCKLTIWNIIGEFILEKEVESGEEIITELGKGIYFLNIRTHTGDLNRKLIIEK
jgi:hypothetical protein